MTKTDTARFTRLLNAAFEAGAAAGAAVNPLPMVVADSRREYFVPDGVCGFGWVTFPGNTAFGRWARKNGHARPGYPKGLRIASKLMTQSLARNDAWAMAVAKTLSANGVEAEAFSRID